MCVQKNVLERRKWKTKVLSELFSPYSVLQITKQANKALHKKKKETKILGN